MKSTVTEKAFQRDCDRLIGSKQQRGKAGLKSALYSKDRLLGKGRKTTYPFFRAPDRP